MRSLVVIVILQLVAVRGDAHVRREINELQLGAARHHFHGRQDNGGTIASEICGWLGGEINQPWVCAVDSNYCVVEPIEGVIGCCFSNFCGAFRTACIAQTDPCDSDCLNDDQNLICSGDSPICATYSYASGVTEVRCESTIPSQVSVAYTYTGFSTPILLPRVVAGYSITSQGASFSYLSLSTGTQIPPSTTAAPSSTPTSTFATSTSSLAQTTSTAPAPTANAASGTASSSQITSTSTSTSTPVGAIVGGVIGGLAIIAAFAALVIWLHYKKHQTLPPDPYLQTPNNKASPFQISPTAADPANDGKDDQRTRSTVTEAYVPPDHYIAEPVQLNELQGETRWS